MRANMQRREYHQRCLMLTWQPRATNNKASSASKPEAQSRERQSREINFTKLHGVAVQISVPTIANKHHATQQQ
jgi:hypothetical protein